MVHKVCKWLAILISIAMLVFVSVTFMFLFADMEAQSQLDRSWTFVGWILSHVITAIVWVIIVGPLALIAALTKPAPKIHVEYRDSSTGKTRIDPTL